MFVDDVCGIALDLETEPGVRFPWFSVTRRTARALPLNEWGSNRGATPRTIAVSYFLIDSGNDDGYPNLSVALRGSGLRPVKSVIKRIRAALLERD